MKRIVVKVSGRVQGVFFRQAALARAEKLNLNGFIRNENDGSVTITAEGEEEALQKLLEWCRIGPPWARIDEIKTERREATGEFNGFEII